MSRAAVIRSWVIQGLGLLRRRWSIAVALVVLASVLPYLSTLRYPFLNWDDYPLIVDHPHIRAITWANLRLIFTPGSYGSYQPIRDVSYMLDYGRGGLDPAASAAFLTESSAAPARLTAPASGLFLERVYYPRDRRDTDIRAITPFTGAGA